MAVLRFAAQNSSSTQRHGALYVTSLALNVVNLIGKAERAVKLTKEILRKFLFEDGDRFIRLRESCDAPWPITGINPTIRLCVGILDTVIVFPLEINRTDKH